MDNLQHGMTVMGIDPGNKGALIVASVHETNGKIELFQLEVTRMPDTLLELGAYFRNWAGRITRCYMENVGFHVKGNAASASVSFSRHVGNLEMGLACFNIPVEWVAPRDWQATFGVPDNLHGLKKNTKTLRKNWIKAKVALLYPEHKWTHHDADAMGILHTAAVMGIAKRVPKAKAKKGKVK